MINQIVCARKPSARSEKQTKNPIDNMKFNTKIAVAAFFAIGLSAYAQEGFIRPEVSYALPNNSYQYIGSFKGAAAFNLAGGCVFGAQDEQEVSLSIGTTTFKVSNPSVEYFDGAQVSLKLEETPILINYRYYTGAKSDSARFYVGASAGILLAKLTATSDGATVTSASSNPWDLGLGLGGAFKLADKIDLDVGYRFLLSGNALANAYYSSASLRASYFYAGVGFKF